MHTIAFIVPIESFVDVVKDVQKKHEEQMRLSTGDSFSFSVYVAKNYRSIPRQALEADVVVARGLITAELKRIHPNLTLVEVPIGAEMAAAVISAVNDHGKLPVGVIGSFNMVYASQGLDRAFQLDIKQYIQESNEDSAIKRDVERMLADGRRILICGPVTYEYASKGKECYPYVLGMSENSIWDALTRARREAVIRRREREKAAQLQTLLNCAHEGIIVTDSGGRVTIFNAAAVEALQLSPTQVIGTIVYDILPMDKLSDAFREADNAERTVSLPDGRLSIHKCRVVLSGRPLGHIITLLRHEG